MKLPIYDGQQEVGKAEVITEGMTYRIELLCKPLSGMPVEIGVKHIVGNLTLGYCTQEGAQMRLVKRVAKRDMPGLDWRFEVQHSDKSNLSKSLEEGVESISALRYAHLETKGEQFRIAYDSSSVKPTGQ